MQAGTVPSGIPRALARASLALAIVGVGGMLAVAGVTVLDALLQAVLRAGVVGLHEITAMTFAVAITACIPAGLIAKVNLRIDVLADKLHPAVAAWLEAIGMALLLLFFGLLAFELHGHAHTLQREARTTVILQWHVAPFMFVATALLAFAVLAQVFVTADALRTALHCREVPAGTYPATAVALVLLALVVGFGFTFFFFVTAGPVRLWVQSNIPAAVLLSLLGLWILMLAQFPLAAVSATIGIIGCALVVGAEPALKAFASEAFGLLTNAQIATLPLFLLMGSFAALSGMADDLFKLSHLMLGRLKGGLAYATIGGSAGFGGLTGSSVATAATMGRIAIPEMLRHGYSPALATGVCAAGGTLGPIVPPGSAPLIVFALLTEVSIGVLLVAAVLPALLTVTLYLAVVYLYVRIAPRSAPPAVAFIDRPAFLQAVGRCVPAAALVLCVMGGLYLGVFNDTQAAAFGAIGAFFAAWWRGKLTRNSVLDAFGEAMTTTAMVYTLIMGATIFSFFISLSGISDWLVSQVSSVKLSPIALMACIVTCYLLLGMVMESFAIMVITVPLVAPLVESLGFSAVWWGIVMLCVVETGMIHPPFGLNVVVLKGITPDVPVWRIYKGVFPFVLADLLKLALLLAFPAIAMWLPNHMRN